ncbi:MAG: CBS domain-containing protein [Gaiellaceae bacterium]
MRVEKIMTRDVITAAPDTPLKAVAQLLVDNRISGVPVCGPNGEVLGVVSEADILRKEEGVSPDLARPVAWLVRKLDGELDKIRARTAGEAMTAPAVTVRPKQHASDVARLMVDNAINRVPVVAGDRLVGIVSRADLVRAFTRSDEEIEREIREDVLLEIMLLAPGDVDVSVENGRVVLSGRVTTRDDAEILERCVRRVPGVLDVKADLRWSPGDSHRSRHVESGRA